MDEMNSTPLKGKFRPLNFSIEVMFDAADKYGSMSKVFKLLEKENRESADVIKWFLLHMANDAELARRADGYDHDDMLTEEDIEIKNPTFYRIYKQAVLRAIEIGYNREVEDSKEEVDLGLQEIKEKKEKAGA